MHDDEIKQEVVHTNTASTQETKPSSAPQNEITFEDIFDKMAKGKDPEVFEKVKSTYQNQLNSAVPKKNVEKLQEEIINKYAETKADFLSSKKLAEIETQKKAEYEEYLKQHGLEPLSEESIDLGLKYGVFADNNDVEKAKSNPLIAKIKLEAIQHKKSLNQPLPVSSSQTSANITEKEFRDIQIKLFLRQNVSNEERGLFNQNSKFFINNK
jgi:hypothetical protein